MIFPFKITNTNSHWDELNPENKKEKKKKKMEIEVERGREAMGEEDEMGRRLCNSEIGDGEDKRSWESREL